MHHEAGLAVSFLRPQFEAWRWNESSSEGGQKKTVREKKGNLGKGNANDWYTDALDWGRRVRKDKIQAEHANGKGAFSGPFFRSSCGARGSS